MISVFLSQWSTRMKSTNICQKPFILSCQNLLFRLLFSLCLLSLSSFSPFLCLCLRVLVVCVVVCGCVFVWCLCGVVWCGVVWCLCGVCCVVWTLKTPCVDSKRLHAYIRNAPVYAGNTRTCFSTCVRGAGIHGDVLNLHTEAFFESTHGVVRRQFCLP